MARAGKWITGARPDQPVSEVARLALQARLELVAHFMPLAAERAAEDVEFVHQLRVTTRRAGAALTMFALLLPKKRARRFKKNLRRIRRAAGSARNLDVLCQRLRDRQSAEPDEALAAIIHCVEKYRRQAQHPLVKSVTRLSRWKFSDQIEPLVRRTRWRDDRPEATLGAFARQLLPAMSAKFFAASQEDLSKVGALHRLRIAGKRFRYAMELIAGGFDKSFRAQSYPTMSRIQDQLGEINDHCTAKNLYTEWIQHGSLDGQVPELRTWRAEEQQWIEQRQESFLQWWTPSRADRLKRQIEEVAERNENAADSASR